LWWVSFQMVHLNMKRKNIFCFFLILGWYAIDSPQGSATATTSDRYN
jgi:hypothetical protein